MTAKIGLVIALYRIKLSVTDAQLFSICDVLDASTFFKQSCFSLLTKKLDFKQGYKQKLNAVCSPTLS